MKKLPFITRGAGIITFIRDSARTPAQRESRSLLVGARLPICPWILWQGGEEGVLLFMHSVLSLFVIYLCFHGSAAP